MQNILLFGALLAATLAVGTTMINTFVGSAKTQTESINGKITAATTKLSTTIDTLAE